ncbi:MAG: hypothetical protein KA104_00600 [Candidatus Pacebacteria bacterium]|nr:hypothetical protein [Candidatus Paceibacterota bacterium]
MKKFTVGLFAERSAAEETINRLHNELDIPNEDISYIYRNSQGDIKEVDADDVSTDTAVEGAGKGAMIGGTIGAIAGLATVAGIIPVIGPLFAAGPLAAALGLTGAIGTTAAGAATGAAAGGIIGALTHLGVGEEKAQHYNDRVQAGDILVTAYSEEDATEIFRSCGAIETDVYVASV